MKKYPLLLMALIIPLADNTAAADSLQIEQVSPARTPTIPPQKTFDKTDTIKDQINRCWQKAQAEYKEDIPPSPVVAYHVVDKDGNTMSVAPRPTRPDNMLPVTIIASIDYKGRVIGAGLNRESQQNSQTSPAYHAAAGTALYALKICDPFHNMPVSEQKSATHLFTFFPDSLADVSDTRPPSPSQILNR